MIYSNKLNIKFIFIVVLTSAFVLFVNGAVPFLMLPTLGQAVWTTGFSQSMANNASIFDFYSRDFGIPTPAAISFGLAGAWPASLMIRTGLHAADAYSAMVAIWLCLAMFSAYKITRFLEASRPIALAGAVIWMTMPIIWAHVGYSMVSLGIALLPFYFLSLLRLILIKYDKLTTTVRSTALYVFSTIIAVFMDGYTFMMFATGSSILLTYAILTKSDARKNLLKVVLPLHLFSFTLAYIIFSLYISRLNYDAHELNFFRGWGLDLSFLIIPSKGVLWLPDLFGISIKRSNELFFGDSSVWITTFALPTLILGMFAWLRTRSKSKLSTGILLISIFGFYMALGPSIKINSTKPETLQQSHPREKSVLMASKYSIAPTGNSWISEKLPGFNVMRASYRWSALGIFALWLLIMIWISKVDRKNLIIWIGLLTVLFLLNLPDLEQKWHNGIDNRRMFQQIDDELVSELNQKIRPRETVVFLPFGNDFIVNYLAPKVGFKTFNIGGDKNLAVAQSKWPREFFSLYSDVGAGKIMLSNKLLVGDLADVVIFPYFNMLSSTYLWPCAEKTTARLTEERLDVLIKITGFICPLEQKAALQPVITTLRALPYLEVDETVLFATVRLRPELSGQSNKLALLNSIAENIQYPFSINGKFMAAPIVLQDGWHDLEANLVWSKANSNLFLPIPKSCNISKCNARLYFGVFGAHLGRTVDVFFNSADPMWQWSQKVTANSGHSITLDVPLSGAIGFRQISISVSNATSPNLLTGSPDGRTLGISLQRIELVAP